MQDTIDSLKEALSQLGNAISAVNEATDYIYDAWLNAEEDELEAGIYDVHNESEDLECPINEVYDMVVELIRKLGGEIDD